LPPPRRRGTGRGAVTALAPVILSAVRVLILLFGRTTRALALASGASVSSQGFTLDPETFEECGGGSGTLQWNGHVRRVLLGCLLSHLRRRLRLWGRCKDHVSLENLE